MNLCRSLVHLVPCPNKKPQTCCIQKSELNDCKDDSKSAISRLKEETEKYLKDIDCNCAPDFFNRVLGPTADEVVLNGLQGFVDIYDKYVVCRKPKEDPCLCSEDIQPLKSEMVTCDTMTCPKLTETCCCQTSETEPPEECYPKIKICYDEDKIKEPKTCTCCKCSKSTKESCIEVEKPTQSPKMCTCCKCFKNNTSTPKETLRIICSKVNLEKPKCHSRKCSKVKICKCCDCGTPVVCTRKEPLERPKSIIKCNCDRCSRKRRSRNTQLVFANGDNCSEIDDQYYYDKSQYYYC